MTILFANRARSTLAGGITNVATTLNVASGEGALFPNPTGGDYFALTLADGTISGAYEIAYCTARTGDAMTITRAQEGTTGLAWTAGSRADNLMTADTMEAIQTAASGQSQTGNYAADTGTADAMVVVLTPAVSPPVVGMPVRTKKISSPNTGAVTINQNGFGATALLHADGTAMVADELPADGLIEYNYDGTSFVLVSVTHGAATSAEVQAGTNNYSQLTPANVRYSDNAIKAWVSFHWTGAAVVIDGSENITSVTRSGAGHYVATLSGGFDFVFGIAIGTGNGANPAVAGSLAMSTKFTGVNPAVDLYTGDSGGSGGQASDPATGVHYIFVGHTQN